MQAEALNYYASKRWSNLLDTQGIIGDAIDTQGVGHAMNVQYSTKRWPDPLDTQGDGDTIHVQYSTDGYAISTRGIVGDVIVI